MQIKRKIATVWMSIVMAFALLFGVLLTLPTMQVQAQSLSTEGWALARESGGFRLDSKQTYWTGNTHSVSPENVLAYTLLNGKKASEINEEHPGAITVTLQHASDANIGSFYRIHINQELAGFSSKDVSSYEILPGWSHTDTSGSFSIDEGFEYVANGDSYVRIASTVDMSDAFHFLAQDYTSSNGTMLYYLHVNNAKYWTEQYNLPSISLNENEWKGQSGVLEGGSVQHSYLEFNGRSIYDINTSDHDTYGVTIDPFVRGGKFAPIVTYATVKEVGGAIKLQIPSAYPSGSGAATENHKSIAIKSGFYILDTATNIKYEVNKDICWDYVGGQWKKSVFDPAAKIIETTVDEVNLVLTNNDTDGFFAISLTGDDFAGAPNTFGSLNKEVIPHAESFYFRNYILVNDQPIAVPVEAFLNVWGNFGYFTFRWSGFNNALNSYQKVTILKGCLIPTYKFLSTGVSEYYEVAKDVTFEKIDGVWVKQADTIKTTVDDAKILYRNESDAFMGISLTGSDFASAPDTYAGTTYETVLSYAQSEQFYSYIYVDGEPIGAAITSACEAFLNVWNNFGYFSFRWEGFNKDKEDYKEFTIKAGCQIPTYKSFVNGVYEVYVVTEDVTFIKGEDGTWVKDDGFIDEGEYETMVSSVSFARDNANNWMLIGLTNKDYPNPSKVFNFAATEAQMSALNLYDKIIVDGYTLRSRMEQHGNPVEAPKINLWQASCLGIRIAGAAGALDGAQKVTIRAGAQFPSYAYIAGGVEAYFITNEEITFVNVGAANGDWERQYVAKFVADGETIATIPYLKSQGFTAPEVPEKEGCVGKWESYTANGNITVNAVYKDYTNVQTLGTTGIKEMRRIDNNSNILVINPTNSDYPESADGSWNIGLDVSHLEKFNVKDYITINGKTLRELGVSSMAINKFTRAGLGLETSLSDSMTIVIKKGCQIPSYAFWKASTGEASCYEVDDTYTCIYTAGGETAFTIVGETSAEGSALDSFANHYTLSDLWKVSEGRSDCFKDGVEALRKDKNYYGYLDNFKDFTLTFDFSFTGASYYETFTLSLGTEGYKGVEAHFGWRFYLLRGNTEVGTVPDMCVEFFSASRQAVLDVENGNYNSEQEKTHARNVAMNIEAPAISSGAAFVEGQTYRITIGYKLVDEATGTVQLYVAVDGVGITRTYGADTLGGEFDDFAPYLQSMILKSETSGTITISDPSLEGNVENVKKLTLDVNGKAITETYTSGYVLPALSPEDYGMGGNVFVGWTTDAANLTDLYPAGHTYVPSDNVTLYAVWLGFQMRGGAGVRIGNNVPSGIRFIIDVDKAGYELGVTKGLIQEIGTIVAPTSYLTDNELTHALGAGYYIEKKADKWQVENTTYSAALIGISADQYARSFSARGYLKIAYTTGDDGYIYTSYNEADHARSIYDVATAAYQDKYQNESAVQGYVNAVADVTVSDDLTGATKNGVGNYTVSAAKNGDIFTLTVNNPVKAVVINGTRIVMGHETDVMIGGMRYTISGFTLNTSGTTISFTVGGGNETAAKKYYISLLENWKNRTDYTAEHYEKICAVADEAIAKIDAGAKETWKEIYETAVGTLEMVKTSGELAANVGDAKLEAPVVTRGDGYEVTWNAVAGADYYIVYDSNDYRPYTVVKANETLSYSAYVVGKHEITVVAHSYFNTLKSTTSNTATTPEVKQAFTYKALSDGLYKFTSSQMSKMGLSSLQNQCYEDESRGEYFVYYNAETNSWSPYPSKATDWSSPKYLPKHLQRLKEMGNNVLLIPYQTKAEFKDGAEDGEEADVWETSRLKYVMDTAWSIGMKVIVCDEALYKLSMSDGSDGAATTVGQVTNAINASKGFYQYIKHPAFFGFSFDDEPYGKHMNAMSCTIQAIDAACDKEGVQPFYLACLFQSQGGSSDIERYDSQTKLKTYYDKWLKILTDCGIAKEKQYLYVDIYTQHAMGQPTDRYNTSYEMIYDEDYFKGEIPFYQALTAHTQNTNYVIYEEQGVLLEQDLYASMMYAAAHNVAGYSWFCFFPISGEFAGTLGGYDGNGYGNGKVNGNTLNGASGCYYEAAKKASKQFEIMQGWLDGYVWQTRGLSTNNNLLTTTLFNEKLNKTVTIYVNADMNDMSATVSLDENKTGKLIGYGVNGLYEQTTVSSLAPGQAIVCGL